MRYSSFEAYFKRQKNVAAHTFYEWINPITDEGGGAYPFRTGISAYRVAAFEIISHHTV